MSGQKTAIVTGGTRGIGLACAKLLREKGWRVFTLSRRAGGEDHISCDVSDEGACISAAGRVVQAAGRIDALINCAGYGISGAAEFTPMGEAESQLRVNLLGTANMCRAVIPHMRARGGGRIVNVSSVAAVTPIPFQAWYSASKAAINSYSMALHNEVSRFGISVCAVMPGDTATGFTDARQKQPMGDEIYGGAISRGVEKMEKDERGGDRPEKAAALAVRCAGKRRVRPLYTVGVDYRLLAGLAKLLPASTVRWLLGLLYGK